MFNKGDCYEGFLFLRSEEVKEIDSKALVFSHRKTGCEVIILLNDDDNRVFMATFKTPPPDDSGLPHILEHSVLNGSRRYPGKEPFTELLKSSLYTFLNAITYPDRTVFPVASRNPKDFINLMDVYLDAIFYPKLTEYTFLQEGWHHHLTDPEANLTYGGVVYSEMIGAYSDPETLLSDTTNRVLYPDSIYGKSSGGHPKHIPSLSYEDFVKYHKTYYHPSNCRILLYGDLDPKEKLSHLKYFLQDFERQTIQNTIISQPRLSSLATKLITYPISPGEKEENRTYALCNYLLDRSTDAEFFLAFTILSRILSGTSASPLRKALIDSHIGESTLHYGFDHDIYDTNYSIGLKGMNENDVSKMQEIIRETLSRLAQDGIQEKAIQSSINSVEFHLREANFGGYPKGLCYGLMMLYSWTYDADPLMHLRYENTLETIKKGVASKPYFEGMLKKYFLHNSHQATVVLRPSTNLAEKEREQLKKHLRHIKEKMSDKEIEHLIKKNQKLHQKQIQPDSPEDLEKIPHLSLQDVKQKSEQYPLELIDDHTATITFSDIQTQGIAYVIIAFDASSLPQKLLPYLPLFGQITLQAGTKKKSFVDIIQDIDLHTGGIQSSMLLSCSKNQPKKVHSYLSYSCKVLTEKLPQLYAILEEIITECDLLNHNRIAEIIGIAKSMLQSCIIPSGHSFVATRLSSYHSHIGQYQEITSGICQYQFLESLVSSYEKDPTAITEDLKTIKKLLFTKDKLKIHLTGSRKELRAFQQEVPRLISHLSEEHFPTWKYAFHGTPVNEGFMIPSNISYVGKGANLFDLGYEYNGVYEILDTMLSRDYLWNRVRVQGGAYGCFARFERLSGNFYCVSYRDPHLIKTFEIFDGISDYLRELSMSQKDLERFIISTIGGQDSPKTPDQKGIIAFHRQLVDLTAEDIQRCREEILLTNKKDITMYSDLFRSFSQKGHRCVVGNGEALSNHKQHFSAVQPIFSHV